MEEGLSQKNLYKERIQENLRKLASGGKYAIIPLINESKKNYFKFIIAAAWIEKNA